MQNAHQQHFSLFNWETHATAHKSSSTRTNAVVCESGETAHKSSSTRTSAVVCEPGQTAHKSAPATSAVVCQPCETALKTSPNLPFGRVVWEPRASAHNTCCPGYLSSVRRDSPCGDSKRPSRTIERRYENLVPANIEQTKKGLFTLSSVNLTDTHCRHASPTSLYPRYVPPHRLYGHARPPYPRRFAVLVHAGGCWFPGCFWRWPVAVYARSRVTAAHSVLVCTAETAQATLRIGPHPAQV